MSGAKSSQTIAVVVHWQDAEDTLGCVASLEGEPDLSVVVVDNGSREPVGELLARRAPAVEYLRSPENLGYAGGANLGIRRALARGADTVLLLNNDARLRPGATAAARAVLQAGDVAVVGPKVLTREDPRRLCRHVISPHASQSRPGSSRVSTLGPTTATSSAWRTARAAASAPGCKRASLLSSSTVSAPRARARRMPRFAPPA